MTEDEKDAELVAWMRERYDLERVLTIAEYSESTDALVLAGEVRRLQNLEARVKQLLAEKKAEYIEKCAEAELCANEGWDEGHERLLHEATAVWSQVKVLEKLV